QPSGGLPLSFATTNPLVVPEPDLLFSVGPSIQYSSLTPLPAVLPSGLPESSGQHFLGWPDFDGTSSLFRPDDFPKLTSSLTTFGYPSASVPVGLPITSYGSFQTSSVPSNPFSSGFSFEQFSSLPSVAPSGLWPSELSASRSDSVSDTAQFVSSAGSPFEFP